MTNNQDETRPLLSSITAGEETAVKPNKLMFNRTYVLICSMYFGVFLGAMDATIVTTLLSHIASSLNELERVSWIVTAYLVAFAAFQPLYGKISDIYGRKNVLIFCNIMFGIGCAICGVSYSFESLVFGRVVSGVGGGGMFALSTISVSDLIPLRQRGLFQGIGNICYGVGAGSGGIFGGLIAAKYDWRVSFTVQVPMIGISTLLIVVFFQNPKRYDGADQEELSTTSKLMRIDFLGSFTLVTSLLLLMLAITTGGREFAWSSPIILGMFGMAGVMLAVFVYIELYVADEPVLAIHLFSNRTITFSALTNLFCTCGVFGILNFVPIYLTSVFDLDPYELGKRLTANFIGVATGSVGAGFYMRHTGKYWAFGVLSPLVQVVGTCGIYFMPIPPIGQRSPVIIDICEYICLFACGFGYASMLTVTLTALIASAPQKFQAMTTSIQYCFRGVGSSLGVSIASSMFQNVLYKELVARVTSGSGPDYKEVIQEVLRSVEAVHDIAAEYRPGVVESYTIASRAVIIESTVLVLIAIVCAGMMAEYKLHNTIQREQED